MICGSVSGLVDKTVQDSWCRANPAGLRITVRLTPGASRDGLDGLEFGADGRNYLKARVTREPEKGKANKALIALVAKICRFGKTSVKLVSGETSRMKTLSIDGDSGVLKRKICDAMAD